jgi:beta-lactamase class A
MRELREHVDTGWQWIKRIRTTSLSRYVNAGVISLVLIAVGFMYINGTMPQQNPAGISNQLQRATVNAGDPKRAIELPPVVLSCLDNEDGGGDHDNELQGLLHSITEDAGGRYALVAKSLEDCRYASVLGDEEFPSASLYKLFVMYAAYAEQRAGRLSFDEVLVVTEASLAEQEDTLVLEVGDELTVAQALQAMIEMSDNASAALLLERIGTERIQAGIEWLGLENTCVECSDNGWVTTANDITRFFELLVQHKLVDDQADQEMLQFLARQMINDRIPSLLPEGTIVAHKTGDLDDVRHDAGIVYGPNGAYIIVVLSDLLDEPAFAGETIGEMSRAVYDYFDAHSGSE